MFRHLRNFTQLILINHSRPIISNNWVPDVYEKTIKMTRKMLFVNDLNILEMLKRIKLSTDFKIKITIYTVASSF